MREYDALSAITRHHPVIDWSGRDAAEPLAKRDSSGAFCTHAQGSPSPLDLEPLTPLTVPAIHDSVNVRLFSNFRRRRSVSGGEH